MMWRKLLANRSLFNEIVCFAGWRPWKIYRGANWLKGTFVSKVTNPKAFRERKWWKNELEVSIANVRFRSLESGLLKFTTEGVNRSIG
ncbi:MAG: hypothetical protein ACTS68_01875 [Candidatus Hodgkinia cicadicola]